MLLNRFILTLIAQRVQKIIYDYIKENLKEIFMFSMLKSITREITEE